MVTFDEKEVKKRVIDIITTKIRLEQLNPNVTGSFLLSYFREGIYNFEIVNVFSKNCPKRKDAYLVDGNILFTSFDIDLTTFNRSIEVSTCPILFDRENILTNRKNYINSHGSVKMASNRLSLTNDFMILLPCIKGSNKQTNNSDISVFKLITGLYHALLVDGMTENQLFRMGKNKFFIDNQNDNLLMMAYACYKYANNISDEELARTYYYQKKSNKS